MFDPSNLPQILPTWRFTEGKLHKNFSFRDFREAFAFMVKVAFIAEDLDHHPNWSNVYNKVEIQLFTHSKGAVTELDVRFAQQVDQIADTH
jgi:4a-hydroxytetrahydrobiopterin dehydratase